MPRDLEPRGLGEILLDRVRVLRVRHALLERRHLQPDLLRVLDEVVAAELTLIREEAIVHLPVLALIARAVCRLRGLEGVLVDRLQRQVSDDVPDDAGSGRNSRSSWGYVSRTYRAARRVTGSR